MVAAGVPRRGVCGQSRQERSPAVGNPDSDPPTDRSRVRGKHATSGAKRNSSFAARVPDGGSWTSGRARRAGSRAAGGGPEPLRPRPPCRPGRKSRGMRRDRYRRPGRTWTGAFLNRELRKANERGTGLCRESAVGRSRPPGAIPRSPAAGTMPLASSSAPCRMHGGADSEIDAHRFPRTAAHVCGPRTLCRIPERSTARPLGVNGI